jgi:hypothetical protein
VDANTQGAGCPCPSATDEVVDAGHAPDDIGGNTTAVGTDLAHTSAPLDDEGVLGLLLVLAGIPLRRSARRVGRFSERGPRRVAAPTLP